MPYHSRAADYWLARDPFGGLLVSTARDERFPKRTRPDHSAVFHALWKELEAGADTPEGRHTLAYGMTLRLPCGSCRQNWLNALRNTPPPLDAEGFFQWQHDRHNEINRSLGKSEWPVERVGVEPTGGG